MRYDSGQFGAFDGLDNRRTIMDLFVRMGHGVPEQIGSARRRGFLQGLMVLGSGFWQNAPVEVTPCSAAEAYMLFVAITGCFGVPIEDAAKLLEDVVRGSCEGQAHRLDTPQRQTW